MASVPPLRPFVLVDLRGFSFLDCRSDLSDGSASLALQRHLSVFPFNVRPLAWALVDFKPYKKHLT